MEPADPSGSRSPTRGAKGAFRVTFEPAGVVVEVHSGSAPFGTIGRPGSLLDIALAHGVSIEHACGGVCACSTCHVVVREGIESLGPSTEAEEDMLDQAPGVSPDSRLACQAVPDGSSDVVAFVPAWNRNLAKEEH
jgi:2Fe-2S ferredoxin